MYKYNGLELRKSIAEDCIAMKDRLRPDDSREVLMSPTPNPQEALEYGLKNSTECYTAVLDGQVISMCGLIPRSLLGDEAVVWFLGTPELSKIKKTFLKLSHLVVEKWKTQYSTLYNTVPSDYEKSLKWLRWLGVNMEKSISYNNVDCKLMAFVREN